MAAPAEPKATEPKATVTVTIDGKEHEFPRGQNLLEACRAVGADVPYFCYHKGLSSPAVCRQCLVEVKGAAKPVPSCYTMVADKMEVSTSSHQDPGCAAPDAGVHAAQSPHRLPHMRQGG